MRKQKHCLPSFSQTSSFGEICSPPAPAQSEEYCDILRAISAGEFFFHIFNLRTRQHFKALQPRTTSIYYNYGPSTRAGHALQIKRTTGQGRKHAALCTVTVAKGTQTRTLISTGTPSSSSLVNKHKVSGRMNRGIQQMDDNLIVVIMLPPDILMEHTSIKTLLAYTWHSINSRHCKKFGKPTTEAKTNSSTVKILHFMTKFTIHK